jgi:hypothetical protein
VSKKINNYLILKTLKKMYKGTDVEALVKNANALAEIDYKEIENSKTAYPLTYNLVKYYTKEIMEEEKISKIYQFFNSWKIKYDICAEYLAEETC